MSSKNCADIPINARNISEEKEAKVKFMNFKSQNVLFFNGENTLPSFDDDVSHEDRFDIIGNCPTKRINFFKDVDSFNQEKNFNSYLFQNK